MHIVSYRTAAERVLSFGSGGFEFIRLYGNVSISLMIVLHMLMYHYKLVGRKYPYFLLQKQDVKESREANLRRPN